MVPTLSRKISGALLLGLLCVFGNATHGQEEVRYVNDMRWVLGDVKQGFIHDRIKTEAHVESLLVGFKNLKVNGIRVPIFAANVIPDKATFDYFFRRAREEGFKLFANPVLTDGGLRIASNMFFGDAPSALDDPVKTQTLINRILEFAEEYPCDWICPFNEDQSPGKKWSPAQYNQIFSALYQNLNGAELIGPCQWGLQAGNATFTDTDVMQYVSVATTHNLGFDHDLWPTFIKHAKSLDLPVWDSEVNNNAKDGGISRIEAAINNKVDGLVLYNSWNAIDETSGELKNANLYVREYIIDSIVVADALHLEPIGGKLALSWDDTGLRLQEAAKVDGPWENVTNAVSPHEVAWSGASRFYRLIGELEKAERPATTAVSILHNPSGQYLAFDDQSNAFSLSATLTPDAQWSKVAVDAQWFYLEHTESGERLGSVDGTEMVIADAADSDRAYHWLIYDDDESDWIRLIQRATEKRLHIRPDETLFQLGPNSWTGDNSRWQLVAIP